jgi:hypothetical protein
LARRYGHDGSMADILGNLEAKIGTLGDF